MKNEMTDREYAYYEALFKCAKRYHEMILKINEEKGGVLPAERDLCGFIVTELAPAINEGKPLEKLNRWIGYVQGTLIAMGHTDVETERDWTRPLFRPLDFPEETNV